MKTIKTLVTISLLNLLFVGGLVYAASPTPKPQQKLSKLDNVSSLDNIPSPTPQPLSALQSPQSPPTTNPPQDTPTPAPPRQDPVSDRCFVVVDGGKYDVTDFKKTHPGGDIFQCNTDMSVIFHSQHDQNTLQKFQRLRVE